MDATLIWPQIKLILSAPIHDPVMLWEIIPVLLSLIVLELYFGLYKKEELGWNSSVSNALVLFFVSSNLFHYLYLTEQLKNTQSVVIAISLAVFALVLLGLDFFHLMPKKLTFIISDILVVNILAFLGIIFVHENLSLTGATLVAAIIIFLFFVLLFFFIHLFEPDRSENW